jgi:hypothetical protein
LSRRSNSRATLARASIASVSPSASRSSRRRASNRAYSSSPADRHPRATHRRVLEHVAVVELQELVELRLPVPEEDLLASPRLILRVVEEHDDDAIQLSDLVGVQIVLRDAHIAFSHSVALPRRESHVRLRRIGACRDQFGRGHSRRCEVQLVLHDAENRLRF